MHGNREKLQIVRLLLALETLLAKTTFRLAYSIGDMPHLLMKRVSCSTYASAIKGMAASSKQRYVWHVPITCVYISSVYSYDSRIISVGL